MQPRTVKGPSWANEPHLRHQSPAKKVEGVTVKEDHAGANPTPSQDTLSDLEWMRQRMTKYPVEDSGATNQRSDPLPIDKPDAHQVCFRRVIPRRFTQLSEARTLFK